VYGHSAVDVSETNMLLLDFSAEIRRQILSRHEGSKDLTGRESDFLRVATDEICKVLILMMEVFVLLDRTSSSPSQ
jgi:hypothetical protein